VLHHDHIAGAGDVLAQLWKEYALSDSRYLSSDPLVLCMETCTVVSFFFLSLSESSFILMRRSALMFCFVLFW
jgi:cholestenol delta-isomerase